MDERGARDKGPTRCSSGQARALEALYRGRVRAAEGSERGDAGELALALDRAAVDLGSRWPRGWRRGAAGALAVLDAAPSLLEAEAEEVLQAASLRIARRLGPRGAAIAARWPGIGGVLGVFVALWADAPGLAVGAAGVALGLVVAVAVNQPEVAGAGRFEVAALLERPTEVAIPPVRLAGWLDGGVGGEAEPSTQVPPRPPARRRAAPLPEAPTKDGAQEADSLAMDGTASTGGGDGDEASAGGPQAVGEEAPCPPGFEATCASTVIGDGTYVALAAVAPLRFVPIQDPAAEAGAVPTFWSASTRVTQLQWQTVMGLDLSVQSGHPTQAVDNVSGCAALRFANALSVREHLRPVYVVGDGCEKGDAVRADSAADGFRLPDWGELARVSAALGERGETLVWIPTGSGRRVVGLVCPARPWQPPRCAEVATSGGRARGVTLQLVRAASPR